MTNHTTMKGIAMKNTIKKSLRWVKQNPDLAAMYALIGTTIGGTAWITVYAIKAENEAIQQYNAKVDRKNALINDAYNTGNLPFILSDGSLLTVPRDTDFTVA